MSCKKERTCECTTTETTTTTYNGGNTTTDTNISTSKSTAEKQTKKFFRIHQGCYSYTSTQKNTGNNYTEVRTSVNDCTLK